MYVQVPVGFLIEQSDKGFLMIPYPSHRVSLKAARLLALSLAIAVLPRTARASETVDPVENWPALKALLHKEADKRPASLCRGSTLKLHASNAVLAPDLSVLEASPVGDATVDVPANGVLAIAFDVTEPMYITGSVTIAADPQDLRPGLRAYVLSDTTVVGAPMIYQDVLEGHTQVDFDLPGDMPDEKTPLLKWLVAPGRHYMMVAGPHYRAAGVFKSLELRWLTDVPQTPKYTFVQMSDTHIGHDPFDYSRLGMLHRRAHAAYQLGVALDTLRKQDTAFVLITGDLTDNAIRGQFQTLANAIDAGGGLPVYGVVGNHDSYHTSSRPDMLELVPSLFPGGKTNYVVNKPPLRFIIVDASYWQTPEGQWVDYYSPDMVGQDMQPQGRQWLIDALAADTTTPTLVASHYPFKVRSGKTQCGYVLDQHATEGSLQKILKAAPNVVATLSGHMHWNHRAVYQNDFGNDVTCLQGPAFCTWPGGYKVIRVYTDEKEIRLEWETRLVDNMGYVATAEPQLSYSPSLSWRISTGDDLTGEIRIPVSRVEK